MNEKFCIMPWISLSICTDGEIHPCCQSLPATNTDNFLDHTDDVADSPNLIDLRKRFFKREIPERCMQCVSEEKNSSTSMRMVKNNQYQDLIDYSALTEDSLALYELDIRASNLCNLSCLTCEPLYSTGWYKHDRRTNKQDLKKNLVGIENVSDLEKVIESNIPTLKLITISGGEPFLEPKNIKILEILKKHNLIDLEVNFNTGLGLNSDLLSSTLEKLSCFRNLRIAVSVDALGEKAEKVRRGLDWKLFEKNLNLLFEKRKSKEIYFQITYSTLNANELIKIIKWINNYGAGCVSRTTLNIVYSPTQFNVSGFSYEKKILIKKNLMHGLKKELFPILEENDLKYAKLIISKAVSLMTDQ